MHPSEQPELQVPADDPVVAEARLMGRAMGVYLDEVLSQPFATRSMAMRLARDYQFFRFELDPWEDEEDEEDE